MASCLDDELGPCYPMALAKIANLVLQISGGGARLPCIVGLVEKLGCSLGMEEGTALCVGVELVAPDGVVLTDGS